MKKLIIVALMFPTFAFASPKPSVSEWKELTPDVQSFMQKTTEFSCESTRYFTEDDRGVKTWTTEYKSEPMTYIVTQRMTGSLVPDVLQVVAQGANTTIDGSLGASFTSKVGNKDLLISLDKKNAAWIIKKGTFGISYSGLISTHCKFRSTTKLVTLSPDF